MFLRLNTQVCEHVCSLLARIITARGYHVSPVLLFLAVLNRMPIICVWRTTKAFPLRLLQVSQIGITVAPRLLQGSQIGRTVVYTVFKSGSTFPTSLGIIGHATTRILHTTSRPCCSPLLQSIISC
jgi:hypothetical protein